jgi:hypothetical protein
MIGALTQLLIFQLIGEVVARGLDLPIPGPVIGMLLLFLTLMAARGRSRSYRPLARGCCSTCRCSSCQPVQASSFTCTGSPMNGCRCAVSARQYRRHAGGDGSGDETGYAQTAGEQP